jgi:hypothetical protein
MLYHPVRFERFAATMGLEPFELCKSAKGRSVPAIRFGNGKRNIILTARHHACESTGSFVLEGVLEKLISDPIEDATVLCVPFVDFDGVVDGDQGKNRIPHDHCRDYSAEAPAIYQETAAIKDYMASCGADLVFDFHAPWHLSGINDVAHRVGTRYDQPEFDLFGKILCDGISKNAFFYDCKNDILFGDGWNTIPPTTLVDYALGQGARVAFTLETPYFGADANVFSDERAVELGRCYGKAIKRLIKKL